MGINGIINVNKPSGKTSFQIVSSIRKYTREKRVGHIGTLDPLASGVLPVCIGSATRIIQYIDDNNKTYRAEIELGISTETYDREGAVTRTKDASDITAEQVSRVLESFTGTIQQTPPRYSALKLQGKRYYELARADIDFQPVPRTVEIRTIKIDSFQPPCVTLTIECGKGTYIRSLAHDIGESLGCGAHLKNLIRLKSGIFEIEDSVPFDEITRKFAEGDAAGILYPADRVLQNRDRVTLSEDEKKAVINGISIPLPDSASQQKNLVCAYTEGGEFAAILRYEPEQNLWHPEKVFVQ
jgi:tRNA pseudouridine55 synthase